MIIGTGGGPLQAATLLPTPSRSLAQGDEFRRLIIKIVSPGGDMGTRRWRTVFSGGMYRKQETTVMAERRDIIVSEKNMLPMRAESPNSSLTQARIANVRPAKTSDRSIDSDAKCQKNTFGEPGLPER